MQAKKETTIGMPHWNNSEIRPNKTAILAWEIYGKTGISERKTIKALQELREDKKVKIFVSHATATIWWKLA